MGKLLNLLLVVLAVIWVERVDSCGINTIRYFHMIQKVHWPYNYVKVVDQSGTLKAKIGHYNGLYSRFYTEVINCNSRRGGEDYLAPRNLQYNHNLANSDADVEVDTLPYSDIYESSSDERLFIHSGTGTLDFTTLESTKGGFISRRSGINILRFSTAQDLWFFFPYVSAYDDPTYRGATTISTQSRVFLSSSPTTLITSSLLSLQSSQERNWNIHGFRLYKSFDENGAFVMGTAVVIGRPSTNHYLTVKQTNGIIDTNSEFCRGPNCISYGDANFENVDDSVRCRDSFPFTQCALKRQTAVDERFFEVVALGRRGGGFSLRSLADPDKYLAVLQTNRGEYKLILTEKGVPRELNDYIEYVFQMTVPAPAERVVNLPRLPCNNMSRQRAQQSSFFQCAISEATPQISSANMRSSR